MSVSSVILPPDNYFSNFPKGMGDLVDWVTSFDQWRRTYVYSFLEKLTTGSTACKDLQKVAPLWDTDYYAKGIDELIQAVQTAEKQVTSCCTATAAHFTTSNAADKDLLVPKPKPAPKKTASTAPTKKEYDHALIFFQKFQLKEYIDLVEYVKGPLIPSITTFVPDRPKPAQLADPMFKATGYVSFAIALFQHLRDLDPMLGKFLDTSLPQENIAQRQVMFDSLMSGFEIDVMDRLKKTIHSKVFEDKKTQTPLRKYIDLFTIPGATEAEKLAHLNKQLKHPDISGKFSASVLKQWPLFVWYAHPDAVVGDARFTYPLVVDTAVVAQRAALYPNLVDMTGGIPDWELIFETIRLALMQCAKYPNIISTANTAELTKQRRIYEQALLSKGPAQEAWTTYTQLIKAACFVQGLLGVVGDIVANLSATIKMANLFSFAPFGLGTESSVYFASKANAGFTNVAKQGRDKALELITDPSGLTKKMTINLDPKQGYQTQLVPSTAALIDGVSDSRCNFSRTPIDAILVDKDVDPFKSFELLSSLEQDYDTALSADPNDKLSADIVKFLQKPEYIEYESGQPQLLTAYFTLADSAALPDELRGTEQTIAYPLLIHPVFLCTVPFPIAKSLGPYKNDYVDLLKRADMPRMGTCCKGPLTNKSKQDIERLVGEGFPQATVDKVLAERKKDRWEVYEKCSSLALRSRDKEAQIAVGFREAYADMVAWKQSQLQYLAIPRDSTGKRAPDSTTPQLTALLAFLKAQFSTKEDEWLFEKWGSKKNPLLGTNIFVEIEKGPFYSSDASPAKAIVCTLFEWLTQIVDGKFRWMSLKALTPGSMAAVLYGNRIQDAISTDFRARALTAGDRIHDDYFVVRETDIKIKNLNAISTKVAQVLGLIAGEVSPFGLEGNISNVSVSGYLNWKVDEIAKKRGDVPISQLPSSKWDSKGALDDAKEIASLFHVIMSWSAVVPIYAKQIAYMKKQHQERNVKQSLASAKMDGRLALNNI